MQRLQGWVCCHHGKKLEQEGRFQHGLVTAGQSLLFYVFWPIILDVVELVRPLLCLGWAIHTIVANTATIEAFIVSMEVVTLLIKGLWTWKKLVSFDMWWLLLVLDSSLSMCWSVVLCFVWLIASHGINFHGSGIIME